MIKFYFLSPDQVKRLRLGRERTIETGLEQNRERRRTLTKVSSVITPKSISREQVGALIWFTLHSYDPCAQPALSTSISFLFIMW